MKSELSKKPELVSVVTPVYNEAENLPALYRRLVAVFDKLGVDWEWVIVDDRSADNSFEVIRKLAAESEGSVRGYRFARNSGAHTALMCGFEESKGDCAVILAGDCQDPPETVPLLLEEWSSGDHSVVWAVRRKREGEKRQTLAFAKLYYWLMRNFVGLKDMPTSGADFFLLDRRAIDAVTRYREQNVSILALLSWIGFSQGFVQYNKEPRLHGRSGWSVEKKLKLVADSVTSFTYAPVRLMSYLGIAFGILGLCYSAVVVFNAIYSGLAPEGWSSLMVVVLVMGGAQMIMMGILGEYLWRALDESRRRPRYIIEESTTNAR